MNEVTLKAVRQFFGKVGQAGLILPDGWFGRPYDTLLQLSGAAARGSELRIELDVRFVLTFTGDCRASVMDEYLTIVGFSRLVWDWVEYGSMVSHREEFLGGEVKFVVPPG